MADDDDDGPVGHHCQACHLLTSRKCSVCGVCSFCSGKCEFQAARVCDARLACHMHMARAREHENLGEAALHLRMLPRVPVEMPANPPPQHLWDVLFHGAKHYLHLLFACTPSTLNHKTIFGMSVVLTVDGHLSAGFQRMAYPVGARDDAVHMVLSNMSHLARSQLTDAPVQRAVLVTGMCHYAEEIQFDALFVTRDSTNPNYEWTIQGIKPTWTQTLTKTAEFTYQMHYRPEGSVPDAALLQLRVAERALMPARIPVPPALADQPQALKSRRPLGQRKSKLSQAFPQALPQAPPPTLYPSPAPAAPLPKHDPTEKEAPAPTPAPAPAPDRALEALRARALSAADASEKAPAWTAQLLEALPNA